MKKHFIDSKGNKIAFSKILDYENIRIDGDINNNSPANLQCEIKSLDTEGSIILEGSDVQKFLDEYEEFKSESVKIAKLREPKSYSPRHFEEHKLLELGNLKTSEFDPNFKTRPYITMFSLLSADGKTIHMSEYLGLIDKKIVSKPTLKEGLKDTLLIEKSFSPNFLTFGEDLEKFGINNKEITRTTSVNKNLIVFDFDNRLERSGIEYIHHYAPNSIIVCHGRHTIWNMSQNSSPRAISYEKENLEDLFDILVRDYDIKDVMVQCFASIDNILVKQKLVDQLDFIYAPVLSGSVATSNDDLPHQIDNFIELKNIDSEVLESGFTRIRYEVLDKTLSSKVVPKEGYLKAMQDLLEKNKQAIESIASATIQFENTDFLDLF
jgi:riboflavin biosynthesis pyrimidine reductase